MTLEESLRDTVAWMQARKIDEKEREAQEELYKEFKEDIDRLKREQEAIEEKYNKKVEKLEEKSKREYEKIKKD